MLSRRGLLTGLGALIAAPAIVRAGSLMPVRALPLSVTSLLDDWGKTLQRDEIIDALYAGLSFTFEDGEVRFRPISFEEYYRDYHPRITPP